MAFDASDYQKRRQQRQQQRDRQRQQRRRIWVRLGVAAGVLAVCAIVILLIRVSHSESSGQTQPASVEAPSETLAPATEPVTVIHFAAGGDLNITDAVVASGGTEYDYTQPFLDVAHLFADADIAAVNLEGNFYGSPYGSESHSAPSNLAETLSRAGVDLVQLANSYSIAHGISGLADTASCVRAAGMEPLGVSAVNGESAQNKGYTIRQVRGIKIAFVAFTKGMVDGMALPAGSEGCVNLLYTDYTSTYQSVDTAGITEILDAAQSENPDIIIAMLHWGSEFNDTISSSQERICRLLQQQGVDVIIGTHAHFVQKMELNAETGNFVAYCLGDLFGDAQRSGSEYSVVLDLEITKDNNTGQTRVTGYSYTPIFTVAEKDAPLRILRIQEAMGAYESNYINKVSKETYDSMAYALTRIEERIQGE